MPRTKKVKEAEALIENATETQSHVTGEAARVQLTPDAVKLYEDVSNRWVLDAVSQQLLVCACESLSQSQRCAAIVAKEGIKIPNRFGQPIAHPCEVLARDHRNHSVQALSKLQQALE